MSTRNGGLWITKIFKDEFGFSDLRSNYSRTYSWMANQLGHMTLGLALVLFFSWVHETLLSAAHSFEASPWFPGSGVLIGAVIVASVLLIRWLLDGRSIWPFKSDLLVLVTLSGLFLVLPALLVELIACDFIAEITAFSEDEDAIMCPRAAGLNAVLLQIGCAVVALAALYLTWIAASKPHPQAWNDQKDKRLAYFWPLLRRMRWMFLILAWVPFVWVVWATQGLNAIDRIELLAPVAASTLLGLVVLVLCKDLRVVLIGLLGISISILTGLGSTALEPLIDGHSFSDYAGWMGGALGLTMIFFMVGKAPTRSNANFDLVFYLMVAIVLGVWTYNVLSGDLSDEWRIPVAGAVASMTVWLVKEFGSDLPNVYEELIDAQSRRSAGVPDKGLLLEDNYIETAHWDARTDGSFYLAGALIGAGVLSDGAMITTGDGAWTVGAEILGLLIFGIIFVAGGRNWAYRQKAIDLSGASRGNMLAVLEFTAGLHDFDGKVVNPAANDNPRERLYLFAAGNKEATFSHLMVVGKPRLNRQFCDALVTEAALTDLPPAMFAHLDAPETWRRARQLSLGLLLRYDIDNLTKAELPFTPLWNLNCVPRMDRDGPQDPPIAKRKLCLALPETDPTMTPDVPGSEIPDIPGAQLVAVIGEQPHDLPIAVRNIFRPGHPHRYPETIWTFSEDTLERLVKERQAADDNMAANATTEAKKDQATEWARALHDALVDEGWLGKGLAIARLYSDEDA